MNLSSQMDIASMERALKMARRALAILEEQAAGYGSLAIPVHLKIDLEEKRAQVAELEAKLAGQGVNVEPAKKLQGDEVHGDKVEGDVYHVHIYNSQGIAIGGGAQSHVGEHQPDDQNTLLSQPVTTAAAGQTPFQKKKALADALLACDVMAERSARDDIIANLPVQIGYNIRRRGAAFGDLMNILDTVLKYPDGLDALLEIVQSYEGETLAMQKVRQAAAEMV